MAVTEKNKLLAIRSWEKKELINPTASLFTCKFLFPKRKLNANNDLPISGVNIRNTSLKVMSQI